ncbi:DUF4352 domain-containing protein [Streptomyces sp. NPDC002680]|uniref:DUF4352 domain-containing protein n=1 Tax=Streptomyces sp. NPDC002680 TaxID=3364659 RepID=UPI003677B8E3
MNQQQPNQHPQQQPGWGGPQTPPGYGYGNGYAIPAPPPPKKHGVGKIAGLGCAGVLGFFVLIGVVGSVVGDGSGGSSNDKPFAAQETRGTSRPSGDSKSEEEASVPVKLSAEKAAFVKSVLADGSEHTSVLVTVANSGDQEVDVNPLYFTITDTNGTKHTAELAADENQIATVKLAPGENVSGSVTGKGGFTPKYVTFTDGFLGDSIRADVS